VPEVTTRPSLAWGAAGVAGTLISLIALVYWGANREPDISLGSHASESSAGSDPDPIAKALALRDKAPAGTATWPTGTTMLGGKTKFSHAVVRDRELLAAADSELWRIPIDGSPATKLATFEGPREEVRGLALVRSPVEAVVALVFPKKTGEGEFGIRAPGRLVAVPLAPAGDGGTGTVAISEHEGVLTDISASSDAIYVLSQQSPSRLLRYPARDFARGKFERVALGEPSIIDWQLNGAPAATGNRVVWIEAARRGEDQEKRLKSSDGKSFPLPSGVVDSTLVADDAHAYVVDWHTDAASAPGGGTYFEQHGGVRSIDLATGAVVTLATGLANPWGIAAGDKELCVIDSGPKLEFNKNATVVAVAKQPGVSPRKIATGLAHPSCLAADADHFYLTTSAGGIARVPVAAGR
jgi:hypothetical protein